ncbi:MAG: hypothetical protein ABIJ50_00135 [Pseudomonadota bacterium]
MTCFGALPVTGSRKVADYLQRDCREEYEACRQIDPSPEGMAQKMISVIEAKRQTVTA